MGGSTDDFARVDAGDTARLVAMMDATDAWPAVRTVRRWVLDVAGIGPGDRVVDVGCGPGTFGRLAADGVAWTLDVDRSLGMLREARRRAGGAGLCADVAALPLATGCARLVRGERVLQWTPDPDAALAELARVATPGGTLAVTDTDWTSFVVDHDDADLASRWTAAARGWVPHAGVAASLPEILVGHATPNVDVVARRDTVTITVWDPDDGRHADGPPGLPLASIATGAPTPAARAALMDDVPSLAARARRGRFRATLDLVTVCARRSDRAGRAGRAGRGGRGRSA